MTNALSVSLLDDLFKAIPSLPERHPTADPVWKTWNFAAEVAVAALFGPDGAQEAPFGPFGSLRFPYTSMGAIDSPKLFGLDELILFSFYDANRARYSRVVDFGANLGLHSFVLARCGFEVRSFEPDPRHADLFRRTASLNGISVDLHQAAVSVEDGQAEFTRVLGNTTGSHLSGAKENPYGDLERFTVTVEAAAPHLAWADLAKIDIEGHEAALLTSLPRDTWLSTDAVIEVGTAANAEAIFRYFSDGPVHLYAQKRGWERVAKLDDMPTSHRDGSLFLSAKSEMPWNR
jgi:FkbM family methyltransferase